MSSDVSTAAAIPKITRGQVSVWGDRVTLRMADGQAHEYLISGVFSDLSDTQAKATPGVPLSMAAAQSLDVWTVNIYLIEFKEHVNVLDARKSIQSTLHIPDERIAQNERLLAVMGQSRNQSVLGLYGTAAALFFIVLVAAVVMIYNTFNTSVMERARQFGLLRCIGASRSQIQRIVRGEGLRISFQAIPLGALVGVLITFARSALLKFYNSKLFGEMPLPTEKSWLISYDANQLGWARQDLVAGSLDEAALNRGNGIVAVIAALMVLLTGLSTIQPLRMIKRRSIMDVIGAV